MIRSSAPTRIDLAGGTLDIWPLYLLLGNPPTLNAAIDLYATVEIRPRKDKTIVVESKDLKLRETFPSLESLPDNHPLELVLRALKFYRPARGAEIVTDCQAPAGSGIAGSSALNIALNGALNRMTGRRYKNRQLIDIAKNIETQVIRTPTGWQDYFPALLGGVQAVLPTMTGVTSRQLPIDLDDLNRRFVLCYTGKPRQSGINNWEVTKNALDGDKGVLQKLSRIKDAALKMERVLDQGNLDRMAPVFAEEWTARKALAPGISTGEMERIISAALREGALAAKVCGAGGGGCLAFIVRKNARERVAAAITRNGGQVLNFRFVRRGLRVREI
ncbi:MAG: GHMP kinase [Nitrospinae bacterium]|nr:GHMP kinase [Nitrospinota bacterium]